MKKTKLILTLILTILSLGLFLLGMSKPESSQDIAKYLTTELEGELKFRFLGEMTDEYKSQLDVRNSAYTADYFNASITQGTADFLHTVLPDHFHPLGSDGFSLDEDNIAPGVLDKVMKYVETMLLESYIGEVTCNTSGDDFLLTVEVSQRNGLNGLTRNTLEAIRAEATETGNTDGAIEKILEELVPLESIERKEYTISVKKEKDGSETLYIPDNEEYEALFNQILFYECA